MEYDTAAAVESNDECAYETCRQSAVDGMQITINQNVFCMGENRKQTETRARLFDSFAVGWSSLSALIEFMTGQIN